MGEKAVKVCLTNRGKDQETPWAHDLGPAPGPPGSRKARLANVPFLHAKPTWGDVIVVSPVQNGLPTWDRAGVPWAQIGTRILEDGGRWAMIIDYSADDGDAAFLALAKACAEHDIICEGAWGPRDNEPGRVYLAVKNELTDVTVMAHLRSSVSAELFQTHPEPASKAPLTAETERALAKRARADRPKTPEKPKKPKAAPAKPAAKAKPKATAKPAAKARPTPKKRR